jgi:hypothetical protein
MKRKIQNSLCIKMLNLNKGLLKYGTSRFSFSRLRALGGGRGEWLDGCLGELSTQARTFRLQQVTKIILKWRRLDHLSI